MSRSHLTSSHLPRPWERDWIIIFESPVSSWNNSNSLSMTDSGLMTRQWLRLRLRLWLWAKSQSGSNRLKWEKRTLGWTSLWLIFIFIIKISKSKPNNLTLLMISMISSPWSHDLMISMSCHNKERERDRVPFWRIHCQFFPFGGGHSEWKWETMKKPWGKAERFLNCLEFSRTAVRLPKREKL